MAVDTRHQSQQLAGLPYDQQMRYASPQFSNPWSTGAPISGQIYASAPVTSMDMPQRQNITLPPYQALPLSTSSLAPGTPVQTSFASAPTYQSHSYAQYPASSAGGYSSAVAPSYGMDMSARSNGGFAYPGEPSRRQSQAPHPLSNNTTELQRHNFSSAIGDARGAVISLSQSDITPTPRNMYGTDHHQRSASPDSYGFPQPHSNHSSISSASGFQSSYGGSTHGSVDGYSLSDYSSASESVDLNHRTLPPPSSLANSVPPAPQSMMGQFSSKVSSSSQKKHKCKVCDKRFTRPSSLQTHMYSHTGEKPFACEVEGCGRHFSVVSNLRRHRKVHKADASSVTTNEDDDEE